MDVEIKNIKDPSNLETFTVYAEIEGEGKSLEVKHSFPDEPVFWEKEDGVPFYVRRLKNLYESKLKDTPEKPEKTYKL